MFINKTNIKLLAAVLLTALAAPSCMNLDETQEGGYGYLTISGLDLDVQVEQLVPTKAEPVTLNSLGIDAAPVEANAVFTLVKDGESQTVQPNSELKLQAGTYTRTLLQTQGRQQYPFWRPARSCCLSFLQSYHLSYR